MQNDLLPAENTIHTSSCKPLSLTNPKSLLPAWGWNLLSLAFAGWLVINGWHLANGDSAPILRLGFAVSGTLCLAADSYGSHFSRRLLRDLIQSVLGQFFIFLVLIFSAIGILIWPLISQVRDVTSTSAAHNVLKENGIALLEYTQDHDGKLPVNMHRPAIKGYLFPHGFTHEQETRLDVPIQWNRGISSMLLIDFPHPENVVLAYTLETYNTDSHAVLFLDGHVKQFYGRNLTKILRTQPVLIAQAKAMQAKRLTSKKAPSPR